MKSVPAVILAASLAACAGGASVVPTAPEAPAHHATHAPGLLTLDVAMGLEAREAAAPSAARPEAADLAPLDDLAALAGAPMPAPVASALWAVHLASYRSKAAAARGWTMLAATPGLEGLSGRVHSVDLGPDKGAFDRLKAGPLPSRAAAEAVCVRLVAAGAYCQPTDFTGEDL